ncbi:MAG TPA: DUF1841 family protein [Povalibacter sp.]|uniref:DUF1841 family protein n=1 Tax=Povalibacter sp. TaxID=1962978 RepID=UPI002B6C9691|nr:DUF1841 family protein [Povalibacter sp.]HMN43486.1 DUF1841 family protein [Povalibacter sp.]
MPFFDTQSRDQLRAAYLEAWRKRRERLPMQPLEMQIADVIELHPEYQRALEDPDSVLDRDYSPEGGQSNPFLHMGLHLAVRDQLATDRPTGVRQAFDALVRKTGNAHDAEHELIECLAETLWEAQRSGLPPDEQAFLGRARQRAIK